MSKINEGNEYYKNLLRKDMIEEDHAGCFR